MGRKKSTEKTTASKPKKKKEEVVNEQAVEQTAMEQLIEESQNETVVETEQPETVVEETTETVEQPTEETQEQEPQPEPVNEELQKQLEEQERAKQRHREFMAEMNTVPEADTREMLDFIGITQLPQFTNAEADLWVKGVARVRKRDTSVSWCIVERIGVEKFSITKIFGRCSPISQVGVVVPIEVMNRRYTAKVDRYNTQSVRNYVTEKIGEKANTMSDEQIMDELIKIEIEHYKNSKYLGDE